MLHFTRLLILLFCLLAFTSCRKKNEVVSSPMISKEFQSPPNAAKPRVWWHWMNGNITIDGIRKDLFWMRNSGIGGFQNFDADLSTPQIVRKRLAYMTPEWKKAFQYTAHLADSLGLEMTIAGSPGWSESGGPWVEPKDGMKKLVWTETVVKGGKPLSIKVPKPGGTTGLFQNIATSEGKWTSGTTPAYYKDIAVIAYKLPTNEIPLSELKPKISSSGGHFLLSKLTDGDLTKSTMLPPDSKTGFAWIQFEFPSPTTIKAVTVVGGGGEKDRALEVSEDGRQFRHSNFIPSANTHQQTISIAPVTGRFFRVTFKNPPKPPGTEIYELVLHTGSRVNWAEEKSAFAPAGDLVNKVTPAVDDAVPAAEVVDLTGKTDANGLLNWTASEGRWNILRLGYSLIGKTNHPASNEATGLEVDKLDGDAVKRYFTNYLDQYKSATGGLMGKKGLQFMVTDSWEAGAQNWTDKMMEEFAKRRGYSMLLWMPALTGKIIKNAEATEKFLFDFRNTLSEMVAEYHYDGLTAILNSYGMKRYTESHEGGRAIIADGMDVKRKADVPMSAIWTQSSNSPENLENLRRHEMDIRESASVAHIYGQNLVAAESLTAYGFGNPHSGCAFSPQILKPTADLELAGGLNRFVIHTSVHQPVDDKFPGLSLGPFGQWFTRHETWAGNAKAWTDYLSRSSYMLQQGHFVADVLVYYGEDNNITSLYRDKSPEVPEGYAYDFINPYALITLLEVKAGKLVTPSGMQYNVLMLDDNAKQMTLPVLRKVAKLAEAGAVICGVVPESTPSLSDDPAEFTKLVKDIWGSKKQNVKATKDLTTVLTEMKVIPDFKYNGASGVRLRYVHRMMPGMEAYWVNNRSQSFQNIEAEFRVTGRTPKLWHPETGMMEEVSYHIDDKTTTVQLNLNPEDAVFVVFTGSADKNKLELKSPKTDQLATLNNEWKIEFQKDRGAPNSITVSELKSLAENKDTGIKYFSGTAVYTTRFEAPGSWLKPNTEIILDLGDVKELAEVSLNEKSLGVLWHRPFRVDITNAIKTGVNKVEVRVTNLWVNRLIGDQQPKVSKKITYTTMPFYKNDSPLLSSGLLGPVRILAKQNN